MSRDLSIIIQGPINAETTGRGFATSEVIRGARELYPEAEIIYSGWRGGLLPDVVNSLIDQAIYSPPVQQDVVCLGGQRVRSENTSRQILSTVAGLHAARRQFVLKLRSDCVPVTRIDASSLNARACTGASEPRIVATKNYTRIFFVHEGHVAYCPMHISDLIHFGTRDALLRYWDGGPVVDGEFTQGTQLLTAEQVLCSRFLRRVAGRQRLLPFMRYSAGVKDRLLEDLRVLDRHFLFVDASALGVQLPQRFRGKWFERHLFLTTEDVEKMLAGGLEAYRRRALAHACLYRIKKLLVSSRNRLPPGETQGGHA